MPKRRNLEDKESSKRDKKSESAEKESIPYNLRSKHMVNQEVVKKASHPSDLNQSTKEMKVINSSSSGGGGGRSLEINAANINDEETQNKSKSHEASSSSQANPTSSSLVQSASGSSSFFNHNQTGLSPETRALNCYLKIFDFTNCNDLPSCLHVCKMWRWVVQERLSTFTVKLTARPNSSSFPFQIYHRGIITNKFSTIPEIKSELRKPRWKAIYLHIWGRHVLDPLAWEFIDEFGKWIITFGFEGSEPPQHNNIHAYYETIWFQLRLKMPFVENVAFKPLQNPRLFFVENFPIIEGFPHLKRLLIWKNRQTDNLREARLPVDLQVLINSPKLDTIYGYPAKHLYYLQSIKKVQTVKSFYYQNSNYFLPLLTPQQINLIHVEMMAEGKVELQNLKIEDNFNLNQHPEKVASCLKVFQRILESSKNSLTSLVLQNLQFVHQLRMPQLPKLKELCLSTRTGNSVPFFPLDFDPYFTFPTLKTLELNMTVESSAQFNSFLPITKDPRKSLRKLNAIKFRKEVTSDCVRALAQHFPNASEVTLRLNDEGMKKMLPLIFKYFVNTTRLRLEIEVGNTAVNYDSSLLGIKETKLQELRQLQFFEEHKKFRNSPSLLNMRVLKSLVFVFLENGGPLQNGQIFTNMLPMYGFDLMQPLDIKIGFQCDMRHESISAILRAVQPIHRYSKPLF